MRIVTIVNLEHMKVLRIALFIHCGGLWNIATLTRRLAKNTVDGGSCVFEHEIVIRVKCFQPQLLTWEHMKLLRIGLFIHWFG